MHAALFGLGERAVAWGRSRHRALQLLSERAQSALCALRAAHSTPELALRHLLLWLALQAPLFTEPVAPGRPLLVPDPELGGALPLVPERALLRYDALEGERAALAIS